MHVGILPEETGGIRAYVEDIYELTEEIPLFYLKEDNGDVRIHSGEIHMVS